MDRVLWMIFRRIMNRGINEGINFGIRKGTRMFSDDEDSPESRKAEQQNIKVAKTARKSIRMARRVGRL